MFVYQLSDKKEDQAFLAFSTVTCRVTLKQNQFMKEGDNLVIKLSNGKSFKGKIVKLDLIPLADYHFGEMEVVRHNI